MQSKSRPAPAPDLAVIAGLSRAVASNAGVDGVLRAAAELFTGRVSSERMTLYVLDSDRSRFLVREVMMDVPAKAVRVKTPVSGTPAAELREALAASIAGPATSQSTPSGTRWPLTADGEVLGLLELGGTSDAIGEQAQQLMSIAADHLTASVQRERLLDAIDRKQRDLADARSHLARSGWLESLGELLAGTAHEFNNLISAILGRAQILKRSITAPDILRSIEVIEQAAVDGSGIVKRIRDRMQQDSASKARPVQLNALVRSTVERASTRIGSRLAPEEVHVEIDLQSTRPVLANATELRQVLTNLMYNAVDAMPRGGRLVVRTGCTPDHSEVWFEVEDSGTGMDEETQETMFQPFFSTKGAKGTGLGLSVSLEIITRHGGRFEVDSEPTRGTKIRAFLPAHPEVDVFLTPGDDGLDLDARVSPEPVISAPAGRRRILVIDDDRAVRDVLVEILHTADYQVVAAASGEEGLAYFRASPFDLVFTDLGMPSMNGWEVAAEIKAQSPRTPVGIITGWDASIDRDRLIDRGVDLILAKPFRFQHVLDVVGSALASTAELEASGGAVLGEPRSPDG